MNLLDQRAGAVRRFNRFYTREIGVLNEGLLDSRLSLAEARVLYELAHGSGATANQLCGGLGLDAGYASRIVAGLRQRGLVSRSRSETDRRQFFLALTAAGKREFAELDRRSNREVRAKLEKLSEDAQEELLRSMERVERLLGWSPEAGGAYILRGSRPGDFGWVVARHGALYAQEYGWDETFEGLVAEIVGQFAGKRDDARERCWIAEKDGARAGCIFLVRKTMTVGKLRLLLVEPWARGSGLGRRLVRECLRFARQAGYRKVTLWTNSVLHAARHIYERNGFQLVKEEKHHSFGKDLVGQNWDLDLKQWMDGRG
jgi:DNA-binding MarR family transcriptional regulator/N-acetylglutamate synthase-like GNAT family acetyltransferase